MTAAQEKPPVWIVKFVVFSAITLQTHSPYLGAWQPWCYINQVGARTSWGQAPPECNKPPLSTHSPQFLIKPSEAGARSCLSRSPEQTSYLGCGVCLVGTQHLGERLCLNRGSARATFVPSFPLSPPAFAI